MNLQDPR